MGEVVPAFDDAITHAEVEVPNACFRQSGGCRPWRGSKDGEKDG